MATDQPPTIDPSWPMGPEVLDLFAVIRAEVAKTLSALPDLLAGGAVACPPEVHAQVGDECNRPSVNR